MFKIKVTLKDGTYYELQEIPEDRLMGALIMKDTYQEDFCGGDDYTPCKYCPIEYKLFNGNCVNTIRRFTDIAKFEIV